MKWLVGVLVLCATASAQAIHIPAGFAKRGGGDAYRAIAQDAKIQVYAAKDVELTTILLEFEPNTRSQAGIFHFERELLAKTKVGNHVSDTRSFDQDPVLAESFDQTATARIYHRRLYAIDKEGVGHLWWTVCKGPATAIEPCEQAQRTMKLDVVNTLVALAEPAAPAGTPQHRDGEPWSFVLPPGFVEMPGAGQAQVAKMNLRPGIRHVEMTGYRAETPRAVLVVINAVVDAGDDVSWGHLEALDKEEAAGALKSGDTDRREHAGDYLSSEGSGETKKGLHTEQRALFGIDPDHHVHMFAIQCFGNASDLDACRSAIRSMRLEIPGALTPTDDTVESSTEYGVGQVIGMILVLAIFAAIPIAALIWIVRGDRRDRRRRRAQAA